MHLRSRFRSVWVAFVGFVVLCKDESSFFRPLPRISLVLTLVWVYVRSLSAIDNCNRSNRGSGHRTQCKHRHGTLMFPSDSPDMPRDKTKWRGITGTDDEDQVTYDDVDRESDTWFELHCQKFAEDLLTPDFSGDQLRHEDRKLKRPKTLMCQSRFSFTLTLSLATIDSRTYSWVFRLASRTDCIFNFSMNSCCVCHLRRKVKALSSLMFVCTLTCRSLLVRRTPMLRRMHRLQWKEEQSDRHSSRIENNWSNQRETDFEKCKEKRNEPKLRSCSAP